MTGSPSRSTTARTTAARRLCSKRYPKSRRARRSSCSANKFSNTRTSEGLDAIESAVQFRPRWYRPPFGRPSPELSDVCQALELEIVYWTAWGQDWEPIAASQIAEIAFRDLQAGSILLLHDSARHNERDDAQPTAEALPIIAQWAQSNGLPLNSLGAALHATSH
jgi:peptidoglycan/xylan/chitin deacetylase (PgdA/CDA1 family)